MAAIEAEMPPIVPIVCAALVDGDGKVLLQQRPQGKAMAGLWEFPGGKINPGESPELALCRELREELGLDVVPSSLEPFGFASHRYDGFHILLLLYRCHAWHGAPHPRESQAFAWVAPEGMSDYAMPEADKPLVVMLRDRL